MTGLTMQLAEQACAVNAAHLNDEVILSARQCLLDFLSVTIAGADSPITQMLVAQSIDEGSRPVASLIGRAEQFSPATAAWINGTASHVLDYDDVNMAWPGHPSVVLWPAILALAGERQATLSEAIAAFVAGYDLASQIGEAMAPGHYAAGFHPTATLGAFASAAASCHMLGASHNQMAHALGIAGTRAAGLKSMFGTMCKPLHAGEASRNGLTAAKLAMQGYQGRTDFIECKQGFAETHSSDFVPDAVPALPYAGYHVRRTLFKFHAACYLTHATIDAAAEIKAAPGFDVARVEAISVETHPMAESVCHIERPTSGLEAKFSLTLAAAMGLMGTGTSRLDVFTDELAVSEPLIALRDKVTVCFNSAMSTNGAIVKVSLNSGLNFVAESDSGEPAASLADQQLRIEKKFSGLVSPILGQQSCDDILAWTRDGALTSKVDGLMSLVRSKRI